MKKNQRTVASKQTQPLQSHHPNGVSVEASTIRNYNGRLSQPNGQMTTSVIMMLINETDTTSTTATTDNKIQLIQLKPSDEDRTDNKIG